MRYAQLALPVLAACAAPRGGGGGTPAPPPGSTTGATGPGSSTAGVDYCGSLANCTPLPDAASVSWHLSEADGPAIWNFQAVPDVTGDGIADVLVLGPDGMYVADGPARNRDPRVDAPLTVSGVGSLEGAADVDGDGVAEVFVLTSDWIPAQLELAGSTGTHPVTDVADWVGSEAAYGLSGYLRVDDVDQDGSADLLLTSKTAMREYRGPLPRSHSASLPAPVLTITTTCDWFAGEDVSVLDIAGARAIQLHESAQSPVYDCARNSRQALVDGRATGAIELPSTDPAIALPAVLSMGALIPDLTGDGVDERAFGCSGCGSIGDFWETIPTTSAPVAETATVTLAAERKWTVPDEVGQAGEMWGAHAPDGTNRLVGLAGNNATLWLFFVPAGLPSGSILDTASAAVGLGPQEALTVLSKGPIDQGEDAMLLHRLYDEVGSDGNTTRVAALYFIPIR